MVGICLGQSTIVCYVNFVAVCTVYYQRNAASSIQPLFSHPNAWSSAKLTILPRIGEFVQRGPTWRWGNQGATASTTTATTTIADSRSRNESYQVVGNGIDPEGVVIGVRSCFFRYEGDTTEYIFNRTTGPANNSHIIISPDGRELTASNEEAKSIFLNAAFNSNSTKTLNYVEFTFVACGTASENAVAVGLADPSRSCASGRYPGWDVGSYGYHNDDGICRGENKVASFKKFVPGDIVGCGFVNQDIFFTLNGEMLGIAFSKVKESQLTPVVTVRGTNSKVRLNGGQESFKFTNFHWLKVRWNSSGYINEYAWSNDAVRYDVVLKRFRVNNAGMRARIEDSKLYCGRTILPSTSTSSSSSNGSRDLGICSVTNGQQCMFCSAMPIETTTSNATTSDDKKVSTIINATSNQNSSTVNDGTAVCDTTVVDSAAVIHSDPSLSGLNASTPTTESKEESILTRITPELLKEKHHLVNRSHRKVSFNATKGYFACSRCQRATKQCADCNGLIYSLTKSTEVWTLSVGDFVKVDSSFDLTLCAANQQHHGGWTGDMSTFLSRAGKIIGITEAFNVRVDYDGKCYTWNPLLLVKISSEDADTLNKQTRANVESTKTASDITSTSTIRKPDLYRWAPYLATIPSCHSGHPMVCVTNGLPSEYMLESDYFPCAVGCDLCRVQDIDLDGQIYHCALCGFDICYPCAIGQTGRIFESKHEVSTQLIFILIHSLTTLFLINVLY